MKRASLTIATLVLMSTFYLTLTILPMNVEATTRYVGGSGQDNYTGIQLAIDDSNPSDTIYVYSGTYNEDVRVYKSLTLIGENRDTTIIRGSGTVDTIIVTTDGVSITGFTAENSGAAFGGSGIRLLSVRDCYLLNNTVSINKRGITISYSYNNIVQNNTVSYNEYGIYVLGSYSNRIADNTISDNTAGIHLEQSDDNTITKNTIFDNDYGIYLLTSRYNVLLNNVMVENGIFIYGNLASHWNTHQINTLNTVNGKPVHYWKNITGGSIPLGAGQVILANCSNVVVVNQNVSNGSIGIEIGFSSHITITSITSSGNYQDGIYVYTSDNITIADSNTSNNGNDGIFADHSITNVLRNNIASSNGVNGVHLYATDLSTITKNSVFLNGPPPPHAGAEDCAICLSYSNYSVIAENSVLSNSFCAFSLINSNVNNIYNNNFSNNGDRIGGVGVFFYGADGNRFTNNVVHGNTNVGIVVGGAFIQPPSSSHNLFASNTVTLQRTGMYFGYSHDNTIVSNYISSKYDKSQYSGITISASTSHILANNVMIGDGLIIVGDILEYSILAHWNTHVIDTSNTVNGRPVYYWKNITGGTVPLGASEAILANCTGVVVENHNLDNGTAGIELGFSSNITVSNNTVWGSKRGIYLYGSDHNAIAGNTVSFANLRGIHLTRSNHNIIINSNSWGSTFGVELEESDDNSIASNRVWDNTWIGIFIGRRQIYYPPGSNNNTIFNNTIFSNTNGIYVDDSYNNNASQNSLVNNLNGVRILLGGNNRIHHNNFIDNTQQAYDDTDANQWDDGYPSGGNYWSDYTGVDLKSGPNQDLPGKDGIGDTPYVIDLDSRDRFPLMSPTGTFPPSAPLNLSATAGDKQVFLAWNTPSFDGGLPITNYRIYRGTTTGGEVFLVEIGNMLTYLDTGLTNGHMYCYRVSAVNAIGEGPLSNEACAIPTATPGAPTVMEAALSGMDMENVTIRWSPSSDDGSGQNSVLSYVVLRGTTYDPDGLGYIPSAVLPKGTTEYVDNLTGEGNPNNYFYHVCAVDLNNLTNCSANQAGKFTRTLVVGPNLISIPLTQSVQNVETVLQTVKWDKAWMYDSLIQKWKSHMTFKPYKGELEEMNVTMGIWVNVTEQSNLTVAGIVPLSTAIQLRVGWNLIGFPSFNSTFTVSDLKSATSSSRVEGFYQSSSPYHLRVVEDTEVLQAGQGYWVWVDVGIVLLIDNW